MSARFNRPPGWPQPPAGWEPGAGWGPDPSWPTPPHGWRLWIKEAAPQRPVSPPVAPPVARAPTAPAASTSRATPSAPPTRPTPDTRPTASIRPTLPIRPTPYARPTASTRPTLPTQPTPYTRPTASTRPTPSTLFTPSTRPTPHMPSASATLFTSSTANTPPAPSHPTRPAPAAASVTSILFGLAGPPRTPSPSSGPPPTRLIGWGALGMVLLAVAGVTVASLDVPTSTPNVDSGHAAPDVTQQPTTAPTTANATSGAAAPEEAIEQVIAHAESGTALAVLADLDVRRRGSSTGYARARFGSALRDTDGNGCDQRNDVLRRDLTRKTLKPGTNGCTVMTGTLSDPYTGRKIRFKRADGGSSGMQIDHVVPLGDAWVKGARTWSAAKRAEFATDPLNLQTVGANATTKKRGLDAARWLPDAKKYRCAYVARQVAVKHKYGMWVTAAERTTIARILSSCQGGELPRARVIALGGSPLAESEPAAPKSVTAAEAKPQTLP